MEKLTKQTAKTLLQRVWAFFHARTTGLDQIDVDHLFTQLLGLLETFDN